MRNKWDYGAYQASVFWMLKPKPFKQMKVIDPRTNTIWMVEYTGLICKKWWVLQKG